MKKVSDVISFVFIAVAAAFFGISSTFPEGSNGAVGPAWFPRIMCVIIILLSVINLITTGIAEREKSDEEKEKERAALAKIFSKESAIVWITIGATLLYVICIQKIGFVVSSIVYIFVMNIYYQVPKVSRIAAYVIPFAITGILYYVFTNLLHVVLPSGILI